MSMHVLQVLSLPLPPAISNSLQEHVPDRCLNHSTYYTMYLQMKHPASHLSHCIFEGASVGEDKSLNNPASAAFLKQAQIGIDNH